MFERFTKDARAVVVDAQQLARDTGNRGVDTRHLLLALVEEAGDIRAALRSAGADAEAVAATARDDVRAGGLDAEALAGLGIDLDVVRRQADAVFGPDALERAARSPKGHLPFRTDAKKALELALREAIRLKARSIHRRHLLLGVLRADCPGRALLLRAGVDAAALRSALEERPAA